MLSSNKRPFSLSYPIIFYTRDGYKENLFLLLLYYNSACEPYCATRVFLITNTNLNERLFKERLNNCNIRSKKRLRCVPLTCKLILSNSSYMLDEQTENVYALMFYLTMSASW